MTNTNDFSFIEADNVIPMIKPKMNPPAGDNWLKRMPEGTIFLCRPVEYRGQYGLKQFEVGTKLDLTVKLYDNVNTEDKPTILWVESAVFSSQIDLVEVITKVEVI